MDINNKDDFRSMLDKMGEVIVRKRIAGNAWSHEHRIWARQWIAELEAEQLGEERAAATEARALNLSMAAAARDAADASRLQVDEASEANRLAREANEKAHTANTIAILALAAATIAIAVAVIGVFLGR